MEYEKLSEAMHAIHMGEQARRRILKNCRAKYNQKETEFMKHTFKRPLTALTVLVLVLCLPAAAMAAGKAGFFRDKVNYLGAITGQTYENATDEIRVTAEAAGDTLLVTAEFLQPEKAPYFVLDTLSLEGYSLDGEEKEEGGLIQAEATMKNIVPITNNKATFSLPLTPGATTLIITSFQGGAKADQDLTISGYWEIAIS